MTQKEQGEQFGGLTIPPVVFDWRNIYRTIAASNDLVEIVNGAQNITRVKAAATKSWRKVLTDQFVKDVEAGIRQFCPGICAEKQSGFRRDGNRSAKSRVSNGQQHSRDPTANETERSYK